MSVVTTYNFQPSKDWESIPSLIPSCRSVKESPDHSSVILEFKDSLPFDFWELGRLLILNGKFRQEGVRLIVSCSRIMGKELNILGIDRILWVETTVDPT